jgi:hypothetical protein
MRARSACAVGSLANGIGRLEVLHDGRDLRGAAAADLVHLLDERAVRLDEARVEAVLLGEAVEIGHRDAAGVEVVGAAREDIPALGRRLVRDDRVDARIEEHRLQAREGGVERLALARGEHRAVLRRGLRRGGKGCRRAFHHELAGGQVVVGPAVDPEQLRIALHFRKRRGIDTLRVGHDLLEDAAHLERAGVLLVEEEVASGDGRLVQMPDERLLFERQRRKSVRIQLHHGGFVDALEKVCARAGRPARRRARPHPAISPGSPAGGSASTRRAGWRRRQRRQLDGCSLGNATS